MTDQVIIEALALDLVIGVHAFEREYRQRLFLDVCLDHSQRVAAAADDIHATLDYATICERLREYAAARGQQGLCLLETLAEEMAAILLREYPVTAVSLTLRKPGAVATCSSVGVRIRREASDGRV